MPRSELDRLLSNSDFSEIHRRRVAAAPDTALAAVKAVTPGEMPLVRFLFALRSAPAQLIRGRGLPRVKDKPLVGQLVAFGFVPLADQADEVVLGYVGQPWRLLGGAAVELRSAADWGEFAAPGYVKAAMSFRVDAHEGGAMVTTETRVQATDERSRRSFRRYWRVIRPGSGAIRRSWLAAAARRAR
jgi:hypothetical protein